MLHRLTADKARAALPLLEGKDHLLLLEAVIAGTAPGWVMVDDPANPHALFASGPEGHYLLGQPDSPGFTDALAQEIHDGIMPRLRRDGWWYLTVYYEPEMREVVESLFGPDVLDNPMAPVYTSQRYFTWSGGPFELGPLPDVEVLQVDAMLLARDELQGIETLREWCGGDYASAEAYLTHGFGVCLVRGTELLGWCTTDCVVGSRAEIGIRVQPAYRAQGYGNMLARAMLQECAGRGITLVGWHCYEQNLASARTAHSAGFEERYNHPFVHVWVSPVDGHLMNGNMDLMLGRYGLAAGRYARALDLWQANDPEAPPARLLQSTQQQARYRYHAALANCLAVLTVNGHDVSSMLGHLEAALATGGFRQGGYD
ncbi:MAG: GNAT family N-acetyltransferase [Anaerolineae bacterium]